MKCPACAGELKEHKQADVTVDVCDNGCGGIWFNNFELQKVDESHEAAGEALLDIGPHKLVPVDHSLRRSCPGCDDMMMQRHYFSVKKEIEVDTCPKCGGVWLDTHELAAVRTQFKDAEARKKAFHDLFSEKFKGQMDAMAAKSQADLVKSRKFAHAFRFICPSHYLPGDQEWGAF